MLNWLKQNYQGISLLQETHSDALTENQWKKDYNGLIFFSHRTSSSRGVAILIPTDIGRDIKILSNVSDSNGRALILDCEIEDRPLVIINVYAPTKDDIQTQNKFLEELVALFEPSSNKPLLLGGDFNIYFNSIDKKGGITDKDSR